MALKFSKFQCPSSILTLKYKVHPIDANVINQIKVGQYFSEEWFSFLNSIEIPLFILFGQIGTSPKLKVPLMRSHL